MKRKVLIIIILLVFIILSFFGIKRLIWNYKVAHAKKHVVLSTNQVFVYQSIRLKTLIKEINGKLESNPKIDTTEVGTQTIKFPYVTDEGYPVTYEVEIEVIDQTPPLISYSKKKTIYTGYDGDLEKDIFCGDNYDKHPKCTIEGEYDVNTPGEYSLMFIGKDSSGNTAKNSFTLIVKNKPKSTSSSYSSTNYTDFNEVKEEYKSDNVEFGIDVSHWQGDINFKKVKEAGVEFAYIRIGRGNGIGKDPVLDEKFERNIEGFNKVGIPVGIYYYSNSNSVKDSEKEVKWILKNIKKYKVDLEIVFDWEDFNNFQEYDLSFYDLNEIAKAFKEKVEENDYKYLLYSSKNNLETMWNSNQPVWLAHYTKQTTYPGKYKVWQLCDDGKVDGIKGHVDLDIRYK